MGKRKERRLAAKTNAGRRVKLDLFAEPSGDLGSSTVNDEVGVDMESKQQSGLPNSPSTSGQQPENPLLLLGQYSDDESEEDSNKKLDNGSAAETSSPNNKDEAVVLREEGRPDMDVDANEVKQHKVEKDTTLLGSSISLGDLNKRETGATSSNDFHKDIEQVSTSKACDRELAGDVSSGWQMVLHEESNQYYYWNTETGETSWEVPQALRQAAELAGYQDGHTFTEGTDSVVTETGVANLSSVVTVNSLSGATGVEGLQPVEWNEAFDNVAQNGSNWGNDNVNTGSYNSNFGDADPTTAFPEKVTDCTVRPEDDSEMDICSRLITLGESLLEKLKSVKQPKNQLQSLERISQYNLEVEIRLSDIKALSSFGSSMHQFWVHSERQLQQLENSINLEIYKIAESAIIGDTHQESTEHEPEVTGESNRVSVSCSENTHISPVLGATTGNLKDPDNTVSPSNVIPNVCAESSSSEQVNWAPPPDDSILKPSFHAVEDVDMDVDMEVEEDATSAGNTADVKESGVNNFAVTLLQSSQTVQPAPHPSIASNEAVFVSPPPDDEWIPPPPPDNEHVPPPPPDEPPEYVNLPLTSYPESGPPAQYAEQYSSSFPSSSLAYYGHAATDVATGNFYGQVESLQVVAPQPAIFYGAVSNTYAETPQITANSVAPAVYYEFQAGTVPPVPGVSAVQSSQLQTESMPIRYETLASDHMASVSTSVEAGPNFLPTVHGSQSGVSGEVDRAAVNAPPVTFKAPAVVSENDSVQLPSSNGISATSTVTKVPTKVARSKKRAAAVAVAPSLRSSKKVSSLVNKWKAAKEELLEDEEEPRTAYEILERKRQKEIEEWHAQQIASGEAKDNANFQPLGGDWRERVKRRRAQQASEAPQTPPETHKDETQKPDLTELSRDLPSSWQAYWDESSKQVYYGNVVTSETRWTKPTT